VSSAQESAPGADAGGFIVVRDRRRSKPLSREELERMVRAGRVRDGDGLREWRDGGWVEIGAVRDQPWLRAPGGDVAPGPAAGSAATGDSVADAPALAMRFPIWRVIVAFALAIVVDAVNVVFALIPPVYITVDVVAAVTIWFVLGRPALLVGVLLVEAVPGIGVIPLWTVVVGLIVFTGSIPSRGMGDVENRGPAGRAVAFIASRLQPKEPTAGKKPRQPLKQSRK